MPDSNEQKLLKKLAISKLKPDEAKDMTPAELAELVFLVLNYVKELNQAIADGKVRGEKGDPGFSPVPDVDFITPQVAAKRIDEILAVVVNQAEKDVAKAISKIKNGDPGKDARVTKEQIMQAAQMAFDMVELPDFRTLITQEPDTIRNSLELLSGDDRLNISAIADLEEKLAEIKAEIGKTTTTFSGGKKFIRFLNDVEITDLQIGDGLFWDGNKFANSPATSGGSWGDITGTLSDQTDLQDALDLKADIADLSDYIPLTQKGANSGVAPLDSGGKIASSYLPALAITDVSVVASQVAQLALTAEEGDVAIRTDLNKSYIHNGGTAGTMADWSELLTPTDAVLSVNGLTGAVSLTTSDIAEGSNLYYTDERVDDRVNALITAGIALKKTYDDAGNGYTLDLDITELTAETSIADDDLVVIYDTSASAHRKMTKANFVSGLAGGGVAWGDITGTLADQTDLQSALDGKQAVDAELTALAGLTSAADKLPYFTGSGTAGVTTFTAFARSILDDADEATFKATVNLEIGTDVQAYDADLSAIAALSPTNDDILQRKAGAWTNRTMAQIKSDLALVKGDVGLGNVSNVDQIPLSYLDTDTTLAADSDAKVPSQKAIKAYVDGLSQGLSIKQSVRVATATALATNTYLAGVITETANGALTIDGVAVDNGDRVLIKDEGTAANNGIYIVTSKGSAGTPFVLTRSSDMNTNSEIPGAFTFVEDGTVNDAAGFVVASAGPFTIGTTAINWTQFSGAGQITAGAALTKSGNTLDVAVDGSTIEISSDALRIKDDGVTYAKIQNVSATDKLLGRVTAGAGDIEEITFTDFAQSLIDDADAATARTTLGLVIGTNVQAYDADLATIAGLTATTDNFIVSVASAWASRTPAQVRTTLGLVIGTNVQAWDADLDTWAGKTAPSGTVLGTTDAQQITNKTLGDALIMAENAAILMDPAMSADGKYNGITRAGTAGTALAFGDLVYLDPTDSRWELVDANSAAGADGDARGVIGICVLAAAGDGSATTILLYGIVRADTAFPTMTVNNPMYISETAGDITGTQPTTADVVIRVVGFGLTADELFFCPSPDYITHT